MKSIVSRCLLAVALLFVVSPLVAQQDSTVGWKLSLQDLEHRLPALSSADQKAMDAWRDEAEELRASLASVAASRPDIHLDLPEALPAGASGAALSTQLEKLTTAVNEMIAQTPESAFHLGTMSVTVTADDSMPSPVTSTIDISQLASQHLVNVARAVDTLPGVSIQHIANRNEAGVMVRGFATRGQVPFYLDGIPISVPYDGFVDFNRFLTNDLAEIEVSKGYSSPLTGPNALGGSINMVTREPVKKLEGTALIGAGSGDALLAGLHLGSRWRPFFVQGSIDWLQKDFITLSDDFVVHQYPGAPRTVMTDRLNHSGTHDAKYNGRFGWTPRGEDEYVFSYINQKGQKALPLYQGPNTAAVFNRFWAWPFWNMYSYYFHSQTSLSENNTLRFRAFYNQFRNAIDMFSNDSFVAMTTASAQRSIYDEHTDGASSDFSTRVLRRHTISASFFFKDDTHRERAIFPARSPFPLLTPDLVDRDQQTSIGLQDSIEISSRLHGTVGFSADHFNGLQGQSYNTALTNLLPFTCTSSPTNTSFGGCTAHVWNYNPQASLSYGFWKSGSLYVTFADRGRFPMLKDIYSASLGSGLPNPDLKPEHSRNWTVGTSVPLPMSSLFQVEWFRSDLRDAIESVFVTDPKGTTVATAFCPASRILGFCSQMVNIGTEVHQGVELRFRTSPLPRLTLDGSYSFLNRTLSYDFTKISTVSPVNTSITILPTLPKNKAIGTATLRLPREILALVTGRYESGLLLQDTTYATTSPLFRPFAASYGTMDLGTSVPVYKRLVIELNLRNVFDRNYQYTAGYPEEGRNWLANMRYQF